MSPDAGITRKTGGTAIDVRVSEPGDGPAVAEVLYAAFPEKLRAIFGPHIEKGIRYIELEYAQHGNTAPVFIAEIGGNVAGSLELQLCRGKGLRSLKLFGAFVREVGWRGAVRAAFGYGIVTMGMWGTLGRDSAYVGFLGVKSEYRGRGIGRALLERAAEESRLAGKRRLTLEVAAENEQAKRLYCGMGFRRVRTYRSMTTHWLFGLGEWEVLEIGLDGSSKTD